MKQRRNGGLLHYGKNFPNEGFLSSVLRCSVLFKFMFFSCIASDCKQLGLFSRSKLYRHSVFLKIVFYFRFLSGLCRLNRSTKSKCEVLFNTSCDRFAWTLENMIHEALWKKEIERNRGTVIGKQLCYIVNTIFEIVKFVCPS